MSIRDEFERRYRKMHREEWPASAPWKYVSVVEHALARIVFIPPQSTQENPSDQTRSHQRPD